MHIQKKLNLRSGFTIVELLIVIVVIAILAVISVVAYNGIQNRANNSIVQSDLANFSKKIKLYKVDKDSYPTTALLETTGGKLSIGSYDTKTYNVYYCTNRSDNSQYALIARSKSGQSFYVSSSGSGSLGSASQSWNTACGVIGYNQLADVNFTYLYNNGTGV